MPGFCDVEIKETKMNHLIISPCVILDLPCTIQVQNNRLLAENIQEEK